MMTVTLTNGRTVETGCYVDGLWGIYSTDHMMDQCADLVGFDISNYPRVEDDEMDDPDAYEPEMRAYLSDKLEDALNAATPDGFLWGWRDGEFFLSPICSECGWDDCDC